MIFILGFIEGQFRLKNSIITCIHHRLTDCVVHAQLNGDCIQIESIRLGKLSECDQDVQLEPFRKKIISFLDGNDVDFSEFNLNFSSFTNFQKTVLQTLQKVPRGTTVSYQKLAAASGFPGSARAVGTVMRKNIFPLVIPCHRVILKSGSTGGYCGAQSGQMYSLKIALLEMEKA